MVALIAGRREVVEPRGTADVGYVYLRATITFEDTRAPVDELRTVEVKAFVPAEDFTRSKQFYQDLGFELVWSSDDLAYLRNGVSSFLLQKFYNKEHADNFMMHLLVDDVEAWWSHVQARGLAAKYGVRAEPPADRPWGIRDFVIIDPTGVLWRIGQNIEPTGKIHD
jgi:catechol 2,3-dioxygenase-like lactoylglutathione lyase family enzyme